MRVLRKPPTKHAIFEVVDFLEEMRGASSTVAAEGHRRCEARYHTVSIHRTTARVCLGERLWPLGRGSQTARVFVDLLFHAEVSWATNFELSLPVSSGVLAEP